ncbi:MAG: BrnT family toxin [Syntrophomonadaceae bacterium]
MDNLEHIKNIRQFNWDQGNINKNWEKHRVAWSEAEEVFFNQPLIIEDDKTHSAETESRYYALGKTTENRKLFIAFTLRNGKIRVISARPMSSREREIYNEEETSGESS